jgi:peptide/nickel transport system permease protein
MRLPLAWLLALVLTTVICVALSRGMQARGAHSGPWAQALQRLGRDWPARTGLYVLVAMMVIALLAPLLAPYDPFAQPAPVALRAQSPSFAYPFGTDLFSRDVLSRVIHGARISLPIALLAVTLSATVGTAWGALAGYVGGRVDSVMMRVIDALLAIPRILLLIVVMALWGAMRPSALVLVLGLTGWFHVSRIVRAEVLALRDHDFVVAARALGATDRRIVWRYVLPSVLSPVIIAATLGVGHVIVLEAGLSFLGIGVQQPVASWGNMIADGTTDIRTFWWLSIFPGVAILVTVLALNLLGDGLRDALDPRQVVRS